MTDDSSFNFQVNLKGMIELLSHHLYSSPNVYVRELLQNSVDAISARKIFDDDFTPEINIEVIESEDSATMIFEENGVGLTKEEVHEFLATIGQSSKKDELLRNKGHFIGQFGIGLLACFMVSDEIILISQSAKEGAAPVRFTGYPDGTYQIDILEDKKEPGTKLFLKSKPDTLQLFDPEFIERMVQYYGRLLPYPIILKGEQEDKNLTGQKAPWQMNLSSYEERDICMRYGQHIFEQEFMDYIPLKDFSAGLDGIAYILPHSTALSSRQQHKVYLRGMLLNETCENLIPEWAFFVKCIINTENLSPTASREDFYEDENLQSAQDSISLTLKNYLFELSRNNRAQMRNFLRTHSLAIRALSVEDDECYKIFIDMLTFETTLGDMSIEEIRREPTIQYISDLDQFHKIAGIAAAQQICIVNGGYTFATELLTKLEHLGFHNDVREITASDLSDNFSELDMNEREEVHSFILTAERILKPYKVDVAIRKFLPDTLPALFTNNQEAMLKRNIESTKEIADDLFASVLDGISEDITELAANELCFNYNNPNVQKLIQVNEEKAIQRFVEVLYVQSLLMGRYSLNKEEMLLFNSGMSYLIDLGIDNWKSS